MCRVVRMTNEAYRKMLDDAMDVQRRLQTRLAPRISSSASGVIT